MVSFYQEENALVPLPFQKRSILYRPANNLFSYNQMCPVPLKVGSYNVLPPARSFTEGDVPSISRPAPRHLSGQQAHLDGSNRLVRPKPLAVSHGQFSFPPRGSVPLSSPQPLTSEKGNKRDDLRGNGMKSLFVDKNGNLLKGFIVRVFWETAYNMFII